MLNHRQEAIEGIAAAIQRERAAKASTTLNWSEPDKFSDDQIGTTAMNAANGEKFMLLWKGQWHALYSSQSEADFALMDIIGHYTSSPSQMRRMFRNSALGQREKAQRDDYVSHLISRSQDRKPPIVVLLPPPVADVAINQPTFVEQPLVDDPVAHDAYLAADNIFTPPANSFVRTLFDFVMAQSMWPMEELAMVTSLGLMAGLCGRQYQFKGGGLNLFMMFLAVTGEGKDAMSIAMSRIFAAVTKAPANHTPGAAGVELGFPAAADFYSTGEVTGKGLARTLMATTTLSTVSVWTEFSRYMAKMASPNPNEGVEAFQTSLLSLYTASAIGQRFGGNKNASKAEDIPVLESPSFSLIAEGTPGKFYSALSEAMITEGLLSRFVIIERETDTVYNPSYDQFTEVPAAIKDGVTNYAKHVLMLKQNGDNRINVAITPDAEEYGNALMLKLRAKGNIGANHVTGSLWRRAYQNMTRIAALLAISTNYSHPTIVISDLMWAERIVTRQVQRIVDRFIRGDVGQSDQLEADQQATLLSFIERWQQTSVEQTPVRYQAARNAGVLPYHYLLSRCGNIACFKKARPSANIALNSALKQLTNAGVLSTVTLQDSPGIYYRVTL